MCFGCILSNPSALELVSPFLPTLPLKSFLNEDIIWPIFKCLAINYIVLLAYFALHVVIYICFKYHTTIKIIMYVCVIKYPLICLLFMFCIDQQIALMLQKKVYEAFQVEINMIMIMIITIYIFVIIKPNIFHPNKDCYCVLYSQSFVDYKLGSMSYMVALPIKVNMEL